MVASTFSRPWVAVVAAAAFCAAASACSSSSGEPGGSSSAGESCSRTADCQNGLVCIENTCSARGGADAAVQAEAGDDAGMDASTALGDAGAPTTGPTGPGGQVGNACQSSQDCATNLQCIAQGGGSGVCTLVNYGLMPTGKTCSGECTQNADCCELPVGRYLCVPSSSSSGGCGSSVFISSCDDIVQLVLGGNASVCNGSPDPTSPVGVGCFYYRTYCQCASNPWSCSNNKCVYTGSCSTSAADVFGGCPSVTRTGQQLPTNCDPSSNRCHQGVVRCTSAGDCVDAGVVDNAGATCRGADCACYQSACYLKCSKDLDCQAGYVCDSTMSLCVKARCANDQECAVSLADTRAKCSNGTCQIGCTTDHDCSPAGGPGQGSFNGTVCDPQSRSCVPVGCSSDSECGAATNNVRTFCVAASDAGATAVVHSAITN